MKYVSRIIALWILAKIVCTADYNRIILICVPEENKIMYALFDKNENGDPLEHYGTLDLSSVHSPQGLAYDVESNNVYWSNGIYNGGNTREIRRSSIFGGESEVIIDNIAFDVLALDLNSPFLYWTQEDRLYQFNGANTVILENGGLLYDIFYFQGYIYYLKKEPGRIGRINAKSLTDEELSVVSDHTDAFGLEIAKKKNELIWCNGDTIMKTNLDTLSQEIYVENLTNTIEDMVYYNSFLLVSSKTSPCILLVNLTLSPPTQCSTLQQTGATTMLVRTYVPDGSSTLTQQLPLTTTDKTSEPYPVTSSSDNTISTEYYSNHTSSSPTVDSISTKQQRTDTNTYTTFTNDYIEQSTITSSLNGQNMNDNLTTSVTNIHSTLAALETTVSPLIGCTTEEILNEDMDDGGSNCILNSDTLLDLINTIDLTLIEKLTIYNTSNFEETVNGVHYLVSELESNSTMAEFKLNLDSETVLISIELPQNEGIITTVIVYFADDTQNNADLERIVYEPEIINENDSNMEYLKGSGILSVSTYLGTSKIDASINFSISTYIDNILNDTLSNDDVMAICAFWKNNVSWSPEGCYLQSIILDGENVTCVCNHLTSFIVVFEVSSTSTVEFHESILSWITKIGMILSAISLTFTMLVYILLRGLWKSLRHLIHMQLIGHIIIFDIFFLCAIEKTDKKILCLVVSIILHFEILCIFMWMMSEAIFLIFKVVKKTPSKYNKFVYHFSGAYSVPIVIVAVTVAVDKNYYTSDDLCWLDESGKWAAVIPMFAVTIVNLFVLTKMLTIIHSRAGPMTKKSEKLQTEHKQLRYTLKAILILVPILGITWMIGPFAVLADSLFLVYIFTILNSLQGVFIFIFYCLLDQRVKEEFTKMLDRRKRLHSVNDSSIIEKTKRSTQTWQTTAF